MTPVLDKCLLKKYSLSVLPTNVLNAFDKIYFFKAYHYYSFKITSISTNSDKSVIVTPNFVFHCLYSDKMRAKYRAALCLFKEIFKEKYVNYYLISYIKIGT